MPGPYAVVVVNYHRVGRVDRENPLHRLHTVPADVFERQLDHMQTRGKIVSLEDVRRCHDLASLNYVISFDDAPISALDGIDLVLQRELPLTLSVCGQLASHGWGVRDKVYCIEKYTDPDELSRFARSRLPTDVLGPGAVSFYHVTKRDDLDPDLVTAELIDPLFAQVEEAARSYLAERAYLSWDIARQLGDHPLVTVANHGWSHANLAAMSRTALESEIFRSHSTFAAEMGWQAGYFTVPFGRYGQRLAVDLVEILQPLGYQGIFWVGETANLVRGPHRSQMVQLTRLHTPPTLDQFVERLHELDNNRLESAVWQVRPKAHSRPVRVIEISDEQRSCRHEMIVRQGKDYASNPEFYRYQFTNNPYRGDRADLYAVECDGRIEATAYNFHTAFSIGGATVPGVYLSSWRKLPEAHRTAAGTLVQKMTAREPIVGVYNPSPQAALAFRDWSRIRVFRLSLPVTAAIATEEKPPADYQAVELDHFDDALTPLCDASVRQAGFTVVRDKTYQTWRHESYPLAACRYIMLLRQDQPVGYAVTLCRASRLSIADFYAVIPQHYATLLRSVLAFATSRRVKTVGLETSDPVLADEITTLFGADRVQFENFYHLNSARLTAMGVPVDAHARWQHYRFHETETTSDVLIR